MVKESSISLTGTLIKGTTKTVNLQDMASTTGAVAAFLRDNSKGVYDAGKGFGRRERGGQTNTKGSGTLTRSKDTGCLPGAMEISTKGNSWET